MYKRQTNEELNKLPQYIQDAAEAGVDAFIIADLGVLALAKKYAPQVERHVSTQAGITNYEAAKVCYELGAKRVVLALSLIHILTSVLIWELLPLS